jgi:hypothetical protein
MNTCAHACASSARSRVVGAFWTQAQWSCCTRSDALLADGKVSCWCTQCALHMLQAPCTAFFVNKATLPCFYVACLPSMLGSWQMQLHVTVMAALSSCILLTSFAAALCSHGCQHRCPDHLVTERTHKLQGMRQQAQAKSALNKRQSGPHTNFVCVEGHNRSAKRLQPACVTAPGRQGMKSLHSTMLHHSRNQGFGSSNLQAHLMKPTSLPATCVTSPTSTKSLHAPEGCRCSWCSVCCAVGCLDPGHHCSLADRSRALCHRCACS